MKELDIGEVARMSGVTPSALRFYEKKGLIKSIGRHGLRRQYHPNVLTTLALILLGQSAGFSLEKIAGMFDLQGKVDLNREALLCQAQALDNKIRQFEKVREGLKHVANCSHEEHMQCPKFQKILAQVSGIKEVGG